MGDGDSPRSGSGAGSGSDNPAEKKRQRTSTESSSGSSSGPGSSSHSSSNSGNESKREQRKSQVAKDTLNGRNQTGSRSTVSTSNRTRDRLQNAFDQAQNVRGLRESGDPTGQTKADSMVVIEYEDGTSDYATPVSAYEDTEMVSCPDEAKRNNLDAPKIIEELGGSACKTALVEDSSGQEYIVKEGIEKSDDWSFDDPKVHDSAVKTLAATHYVGNGDVTVNNFRVSENGEFTIIDHDVAGAEFSPVQRSTRFSDIDQTAVKERIYDIACEFKRGDRSMPDGISPEMQQQVSNTIDRSFKEAQRDPSYDVGAAGQNINSLPVSDLSQLNTGDQIEGYHSAHEPGGRVGPDVIANAGSGKLRGNSTTSFEILSVEESSEGTTVKAVAVEDKQSDAAPNPRTYLIKDNAQVREVK